MCGFAYAASLMIYQFGGIITGEVSFGMGTAAAIVVLVILLCMIFRKNIYDENTLTISAVAALDK